MPHKQITDLMNEQINYELYSAYLYLDMSQYFATRGLDGLCHWYEVQAHEELDHAMKFIHHMEQNNMPISLKQIERPGKCYSRDIDVFADALAHEEFITSCIHNLYSTALEAHDFRTAKFLDWFVEEQDEEEQNARNMIAKIENFGGNYGGRYMLNQEFLSRKK